jgi:hypothetical protein
MVRLREYIKKEKNMAANVTPKFSPSQVWLACEIVQEGDLETEIKVKLQDNSTTNIKVHPSWLNKDKEGRRYVRCESFGRKDKLLYIKLPRPSLQHGHNITVNEVDTKVRL